MVSSARVIVDSKDAEAAIARKQHLNPSHVPCLGIHQQIHPFQLVPGDCNARYKRRLEFAKSWS